MPTMNVSLTQELENFVGEKVKTGRYQTSSEVVREALRLLEENDLRKKALRQDIQAGLDQLDRGEGIPAEAVDAELGRRRRVRAAKRS